MENTKYRQQNTTTYRRGGCRKKMGLRVRVCTSTGKPEKSWNLTVAFSIFQDFPVLEKSYWCWKVLKI